MIIEEGAHKSVDSEWVIFAECANCGEEIMLVSDPGEPESWEHRWTETVRCLATTFARPTLDLPYDYSGRNGTPVQYERCRGCGVIIDSSYTEAVMPINDEMEWHDEDCFNRWQRRMEER